MRVIDWLFINYSCTIFWKDSQRLL